MDHFASIRDLEMRADALKLSKSAEAVAAGEAALKALKDHRYTEAENWVKKGRSVEVLPLHKFCLEKGLVPSKGHFSRLLNKGQVRVDGKITRDPDMDIRHAKSVRVGPFEATV